MPVKVREWIGPALESPDFVLDAQPPAQPHSGVVVDRPVRFGDGAYFEVVRPSAQRAVQLTNAEYWLRRYAKYILELVG